VLVACWRSSEKSPLNRKHQDPPTRCELLIHTFHGASHGPRGSRVPPTACRDSSAMSSLPHLLGAISPNNVNLPCPCFPLASAGRFPASHSRSKWEPSGLRESSWSSHKRCTGNWSSFQPCSTLRNDVQELGKPRARLRSSPCPAYIPPAKCGSTVCGLRRPTPISNHSATEENGPSARVGTRIHPGFRAFAPTARRGMPLARRGRCAELAHPWSAAAQPQLRPRNNTLLPPPTADRRRAEMRCDIGPAPSER
jgi:hypothetical protein